MYNVIGIKELEPNKYYIICLESTATYEQMIEMRDKLVKDLKPIFGMCMPKFTISNSIKTIKSDKNG